MTARMTSQHKFRRYGNSSRTVALKGGTRGNQQSINRTTRLRDSRHTTGPLWSEWCKRHSLSRHFIGGKS